MVFSRNSAIVRQFRNSGQYSHYIAAIVFALLVVYQNCGTSLYTVEYYLDPFDSVEGYGQKNLVSDCMNDPNYNTCVFWKGPVSQNSSALNPAVNSSSDLSALQIQAENVQGDEKGELSNSSVYVVAEGNGETGHGPYEKATAVSGQYKFSYKDDPNHKVGQVHSFVWATSMLKLMTKNLGTWYATGKRIKINSYFDGLENAYWNGNSKSPQLVLGQVANDSSKGEEFGLDGGVLAHEFAHANLSYATSWAIYEGSDEKNVKCGVGSDGECCIDEKGCSGAINEGQADYSMAILFYQPNNVSSVSLGETYENNLVGLVSCKEGKSDPDYVPRNLFGAAKYVTTASDAYSSCGKSLKGEIHAMGTLYASMWWTVRQTANGNSSATGTKQTQEVLDIDTIFMEHLALLKGDDDFVTALDLIKSVDSTYFDGKYYSSFQAEWRRRGLIP